MFFFLLGLMYAPSVHAAHDALFLTIHGISLSRPSMYAYTLCKIRFKQETERLSRKMGHIDVTVDLKSYSVSI